MKRICALALLVAASPFVLGLLNSQPHPAIPTVLTSVEVVTDRLDALGGDVVELQNALGSAVAVTSTQGQTPWLALDVSVGCRLVLTERAHSAGISIGMIEQVPAFVAVDPTADTCHLTISRTQPLAVPVLVEGKSGQANNFYPWNGDWPHWMISVPADSTLRFGAHLASLLDNEAIDHFLAYRGHEFVAPPMYVRGVDVVVPGVDLGAEGLLIGIALLGDLSGGVTLDAFHYAQLPALAPSGPGFQAEMRGVLNDVAYVHLSGKLRRGHLALLLRPNDGQPGIVRLLQDSPPTVIVPPAGGGGVESAALPCDVAPSADPEPEPVSPPRPGATSAFVTDCEPPVPNQGNWTCDPIAPTATNCGAAVPDGAVQCEIIRSRTAKWCRPPGFVVKAQSGRTAKWKVAFQLGGGGGNALTSGGGFEYGEESIETITDEWTAGAGAHGLGQCMRFFRFELTCARRFSVTVDRVWVVEGVPIVADPCGLTLGTNRVCRDTNISASVCDRTP